MKKLLLLICITILGFGGFAQPLGSGIIDVNNISARFLSDGSLAFSYDSVYFEYPKGSGIRAIFAGNFWISGIDTIGNLHLAANRYSQGGRDFFPGPVANIYDAVYDSTYNRVWKISDAAINYHRQHFADPGYVASPQILDWPGNGNVTNGEAAILAPFADLNGNSVYEPMTGEYPLIKGDEALYIIYSDVRDVHTETNGLPLGVEMHLMIYGFNLPSNPDVNNSLFLSLKVINRSVLTYSPFKLGWWNDFDLGCFSNDRVGCDTLLNTFFAYDGGADSISCHGILRYDSVHIGLGATFLNHSLKSFTYFTNGAQFSQTDPSLPSQYYNYMSGFWNDGTPFTEGGRGYGGTIPTKFAFPGNPCDTTDWSDATSSFASGDRRGLGTTGDLMLLPNSYLCFDMVYTFAEGDTGLTCTYSEVDALKQAIQNVQNFYSISNLSCAAMLTGIPATLKGFSEIICFPNPAATHVKIQSLSQDLQIERVNMLSLDGRMVLSVSGIGRDEVEVNVSELPSGIYVAVIETTNGILHRRLVVE